MGTIRDSKDLNKINISILQVINQFISVYADNTKTISIEKMEEEINDDIIRIKNEFVNKKYIIGLDLHFDYLGFGVTNFDTEVTKDFIYVSLYICIDEYIDFNGKFNNNYIKYNYIIDLEDKNIYQLNSLINIS